jgi:peroxiredoxin Q/BCP
VRNAAGAKGSDVGVKLFVDEGDAIRTEIGIQKDLFGLLGGRETYVVDASGTVASVFNSPFSPEEHVKTALAAVKELPADKNPLEDFLGKLGLKF